MGYEDSLMDGYREAAEAIMADEGTQYGVINDVAGECGYCRPYEAQPCWLGYGDNAAGYPYIGDFEEGGLFHHNCRHYVIPFTEGMNLEELFPVVTADPLGWEVSQWENYVTRNLYEWQRKYAAAMLTDDKARALQHLNFWYQRWLANQADPVATYLKHKFVDAKAAETLITKLFPVKEATKFNLASVDDWINLTKAVDKNWRMTGSIPYKLSWYQKGDVLYLNATTDYMGSNITMSHGLHELFTEDWTRAMFEKAQYWMRIHKIDAGGVILERDKRMLQIYLDSYRIAAGKAEYTGQIVTNIAVIPDKGVGIIGTAYNHEFGHWLSYDYLAQFGTGALLEEDEAMAAELRKMIPYALARSGDVKYYAVSVRSLDSWQECVAENWALYVRGYKRYLKPDMRRLFDAIVKGRVKPL